MERSRLLARPRYLVFAVLLGVAILVNTVQFRSIDENTSAHFAALHRYGTGDIVEIGYDSYGNFGEMYALYLTLAEIAPGSRVVILGPGRLTRHEFVTRLYGFGEVAGIERVEDADLVERLTPGSGFDPTPFVVARGKGGDKGPPWAVAVGAPDPRPTGMRDPDSFLAEVLAGERPGTARGPAREFLLMEWWQPVAGAGWDRQDLLVEIPLLPADVREELAG